MSIENINAPRALLIYMLSDVAHPLWGRGGMERLTKDICYSGICNQHFHYVTKINIFNNNNLKNIFLEILI